MEEFVEKDSFEFGNVINNNNENSFETVDNENVFEKPFSNFGDFYEQQGTVENSEVFNTFENQYINNSNFGFETESNNEYGFENQESISEESNESFMESHDNVELNESINMLESQSDSDSNFGFETESNNEYGFKNQESISEESNESFMESHDNVELNESINMLESQNDSDSNFNFEIKNVNAEDFENQELISKEVAESSESIDMFQSQRASNFVTNINATTEEKFSYDNDNFVVNEFENSLNDKKIDNEFLEENPETFNSAMNDTYEYDVVAPTLEPVVTEKVNQSTNIVSDTPIEELNKLTEYKEEKISVTDIKSLFNRVGTNVQEASDIFVKNTEMKERIDAKFEELKQLQSTIENAKKTQYDEINAYKEEVFGKLTEKKNEVEERINKLKEFQDNLEKEKEEFEKYKNEQTAEIERVQKEVQDAYESRREELNHIEDVLRKQKDSLDEERNQLSLDKIQYEADKNELANNLLKFNQIVDSFTIGMESAGKGE